MGESMASRLTMLSFLSLAFAFYFLAVSPLTAHGYTMTYYQQDNGTTSPVSTYAPSVFWSGACTATVFGYSTGRDADGSYSVLSQYFSPDMTEKATSSYSYTTNQTCKLQTTTAGLNFSTPLNGFYENSQKTTFTASMSQDSFLKVVYNCESQNEYFRYYGGWLSDSYSNHPNAYMYSTSCCEAGTYGCGTGTKALQYENVSVKNMIGKAHTCGGYLTPDDDVSVNCGSVSSGSWALSHWVIIPFSSGVSGKINLDIYGLRNGINFSTSGPNYIGYQIYIIKATDNQTYNLGAADVSTFTPLSWANYTLEKNTDYHLAIGIMRWGQRTTGGTLTHNVYNDWINYSLEIWDYEPDFSCTAWSSCDTDTYTKDRICTDLNGKVPIEVQTESCTATSETVYEKVLGFEDGTPESVYVCTQANTGFGCATSLQSYYTSIPVNWTNAASKDITGTIMENTAKLTSIYGAKVGINALMLRYIPPKQLEPIVSTSFPYPPTECGNKTIGSNGEVSSPYNNGTYIETNVTLSNNPEISYYSKRCPYSEVQYDTLADAFIFGINASCGKMYYDGSYFGNKTINGNYQVLVQGWQNVSGYMNETYNVITTTENILINTTVVDGNKSYCYFYDYFGDNYGLYISASTPIFHNGTIIRMYITDPVDPNDLTFYEGETTYSIFYGGFTLAGDGFYTVTLNNIPNETSSLYVHSPAGNAMFIDYIGIENEVNFTTEYINFPFTKEATDEWVKTIVPLSHLGLQDNGLYTIYLGVTSKTGSSVDPNPSCVLFDDFTIQNSETLITEESCTSGCDSENKYIKGEWVGYCLRYEYPEYAKQCLTSADASIVSQIEAGTYGQDWYCTDDGAYHEYNSVMKLWVHSTNTTLCSTIVINQAENNQTTSVAGELFDLGVFNFLLSPFMIIMYIAMILAGIISYYTEAWELGALVVVMVLIGGTFGGIVPSWILFTIVISVVALIAYKVSQTGGG